MRFAVRVVLCLFAATVLAVGCRKALEPNIDRNQPPETWITAAPFDTLTARDPAGHPIFPPINPADHTIPVRFHMYWAGADRDGAVVGYYWAVVETSIVSPDGGTPPLPGPKPQDYHFTTRTDSIFIFNVAENVRDRQHGFFIFAVDNQGKADPTPAHFSFIAIDNYPPQPVIDLATGTDTIVSVGPAGELIPQVVTVAVHDTLPPPTHPYPPTDTVPARSVLNFHWFSNLRIAGSNVLKYSYKLDESSFVPADSSVHSVTYNSGIGPRVAPGLKVFTVRAIDQAGGSGETTRRFVMNYSPDTWWSGPDPSNPAFTLTASDPVFSAYHDGKSVQVLSYVGWPGIPNTYVSADSTRDRPSVRPVHRTFLETWKDRIWVRTEFDTVHMNSLVSLWNGGYDKDSPYAVKVDPTDPGLPSPPGAVLTPGGRVGAPIGFRSVIITKMDPDTVSRFAPQKSITYPVFEPASVLRQPHIGAYWLMNHSGKAYALVQAQDADGGDDRAVDDPVLVADDNDWRHSATPDEVRNRSKVLVFYVNKAPVFNTTVFNFAPRLDGSNGISPTSYTVCRGSTWAMNMPAYDIDPYNTAGGQALPPPGGASTTSVFSLHLRFTAQDTTGADTTWTYDPPNYPSPSTSFNVPIPRSIAAGVVTMKATLCDCDKCIENAGSGRCANYTIHFNYIWKTSGCTEPADITSDDLTRPGSNSRSWR